MILLNSTTIAQTVNEVATATVDTVATAATTAATAATAATATTTTTTTSELSIWELCLEGGFIMIPLAILSIIAIYIFIERAVTIAQAAKQDPSFMKRIKDYVHDGEIESAQNLCRTNPSPAARLIAKGLARIGRPASDVLVAIENTGNIEIATLSKGLPWLATTAAAAPMLGFLGTVIGMVDAFFSIANSGNAASIGDFAGGIYTALITTVAGLVVGIIALFAYNYLVARINKVMNQLEARTMEFMDLINEPKK